jgi:ribosomal protein L40E
MGARFTCRSCQAPLPKRGSRCRICGWAVDYDPKTGRQEREAVLGISLLVLGIVLAIALAIAYTYLKPQL